MKKVLLFAVAAAALFASCAKDGNNNGVAEVRDAKLTLKIGNAATTTRTSSTGKFDATTDVITVNSAYVMVFDPSTERLIKKQPYTTASDINDLKGAGKALPGTVANNGVVLVYANVGADFATAFGGWATGKETGEKFEDIVKIAANISGQTNFKTCVLGNVDSDNSGIAAGDLKGMNLKVGTTDEYTCDVEIAPMISRVELGYITASSTPSLLPSGTAGNWVVTSFKVDTVYVGDFKKQYNYAGQFNDEAGQAFEIDPEVGSAANFTNVVAFWAAYGDGYASPINSSTTAYVDNETTAADLDDVKVSGTPAQLTVDGNGAALTPANPAHVWSYNVVSGYNPHIVIALKDIVLRNIDTDGSGAGTTTIANGYLTIKQFKKTDGTNVTLERGKVYFIGKTGMAFQPINITNSPDEEAPQVELTVNVDVKEWTLEDTNVGF